MSDKPNKMNNFWQELKRRKVIYVITVYASAAFVIIELVNNVLEPLNLPENLSTIVIIALAIAFPIVVILSWIFDVKPGGVEKTKPADEVTEGKKEVTSNAWRIATYVSVVMIAGLIIFNVFTRLGLTDELTQYGKSIAVLPFINDSQSEEDEMFINGIMVSITNKLCNIKDLRVMTRQSVEQYRDTIVPVAEIAEKLGVSYVLSSSLRKYGERIVMSHQLIDQSEKTVWAREYDRDIDDIEELFEMESQIAQLIAREIKTAITPEEKQRIEKVPTTNILANQLWQRGEQEFLQFIADWDFEYLKRAESLFRDALKQDTTMVEPWVYLGWVYYVGHGDTHHDENFPDSMLFYSDMALSYNDQYSEAYVLRAKYYQQVGDWNAAFENYNLALEFNPNDALAYHFRAGFYCNFFNDYVNAILDFEEAEKRQRDEQSIGPNYRDLGNTYRDAGFGDIAKQHYHKWFVYKRDSASYFNFLANNEHSMGNYQEAAELELKAYSIRPTLQWIGLMDLIFSGQDEEAYKWAKQFEENVPRMQRVQRGYIYWIHGEKDKAEELFRQVIDDFESDLLLGTWGIVTGYKLMEVIPVYAFMGESEKAYQYLDELLDMKHSFPIGWISWMKQDPMLDNLRDEKRFQDCLDKMEDKYINEHEKVLRYLKETGRM